jgi:hypothetical protein
VNTPSLRKLWTIYKTIMVKGGASRREQIVAQGAFYSGAWGVLEMMNHLLNEGDYEELERVIRLHARTIQKIRGDAPRKRRH